ncbi:MAG TPA: hypothetical protein VJC05_02405 [Candidatus Andersenbacteria bacterium]|nr:hypothetical protein [Candidatus Andersenbacteria bacterium]
MKYGRYGWPYLWLRGGLGLTFTWIGVDILRHPDTWIGYLPAAVTEFGVTREMALQMNGALDLTLGLLLLFNVWPRLAGAVATAHLAGILVVHGVDAVVIRDVGLLGASLALVTWPRHYHKNKP